MRAIICGRKCLFGALDCTGLSLLCYHNCQVVILEPSNINDSPHFTILIPDGLQATAHMISKGPSDFGPVNTSSLSLAHEHCMSHTCCFIQSRMARFTESTGRLRTVRHKRREQAVKFGDFVPTQTLTTLTTPAAVPGSGSGPLSEASPIRSASPNQT